jgi:hypothetical protein
MDLLAPARLKLAIKCASSPATTGSSRPHLRPSPPMEVPSSPTQHSLGPQLLTRFASGSLTRPEVSSPSPPIGSIKSNPPVPPVEAAVSQPTSLPLPIKDQVLPQLPRLPTFSEVTPPDDHLSSSAHPFIPYVSKMEALVQDPPSTAEPSFDSVRQLLSTIKLPHTPGLNLPQDPLPPPSSLLTSLIQQPYKTISNPALPPQDPKPSLPATPMLPMPSHLTHRTRHPAPANRQSAIVLEETKKEKEEDGDKLSKWRKDQLQALDLLLERGLPSDKAFWMLGISSQGTDKASLQDKDENLNLSLVPVRLVKLVAVRSLTQARQASLSLGLRDLVVKMRDVKKELDLSNAYEAALKLGVPKSRLGKFRRLGVTGFSVSVLVQLYSKLRLKLCLTVLKQRLGLRKDLEALIEQSTQSTSPGFAGLVMQRWHKVARDEAIGRSKSALFHHQ